MIQKKIAHYFFLVVLILLLSLAFLIVKPYATYLLLALVLVFSFYPTYLKLKKVLRSPNLTSLVLILFIIAIIVLPLILVATSIIDQAGSAYNNYDPSFAQSLSHEINTRFNTNVDLTVYVEEIFGSTVSFFIRNAAGFVGGLAELVLGLFIMFVGMFYLFKKGHVARQTVMQYIPLKQQYKEDLINEIESVTHAVVYSQVLVSLVQGILLGISFAIFGLPNPIFWGFIGALLSFLPVVGPPMLWITAGAIQLLTGNVGVGIGVLIFNAVITMNIDNLMRPRLMGGKSKLHPFVALIGIIGGIKIFGFIGLLLGPMIIALFLVLLKYFNKEF